MADFTIEGIITVDSTKAIRTLTSFQNKLRSVTKDVKALDEQIDSLDGKRVELEVITRGQEEITQLKEELEAIRDETVHVNMETTGVEDALSDAEKLEAEIRAISSDDVETKVVLAGAEKAITQAIKLHEELEAVTADDIDIKVKTDTSQLSKLKSKIGEVTSSIRAPSFGLIPAIAGIIPALIPIGAAAAGVTGGIVSSMAVATSGVGAFAAFAIPTLKDVAAAVKLLATETEDLNPDQLAEYNKKLAELKKTNPLVYKAAKAFMALKEKYMKFVDAIKPDVLKATNQALKVAGTLIGYLGPIAQKVAPVVTGLFEEMNQNLRDSSDWQKFFDYLEKRSGGFIKVWARTTGNFIAGISNMIVAFDPLARFVNKGFLSMSRRFREWSAGLDKNKSFQAFVAYVKENGPKVMHLLGGLVDLIIGLAQSLAPLGSKLLDSVNGLLDMYNNLKKTNPKLADMLAKGALLVAVLSPFAGTLMSIGGALISVAGPAGIVAAALAAIIGVLVFSKRGTKQYSEMMGKIKDTFDDLVDAGKDVWAFFKKLWESFKKSGSIERFQKAIGNYADAFKNMIPVLKDVAKIVGVVLYAAFYALSWAMLATSNSFKFLTKLWSKMWAGIKWVAVSAYNIIAHGTIPKFVKDIWGWFGKLGGKTKAIFSAIKNWIVSKITGAKNAATNKIKAMVNAVKNWWNNLKAKTVAIYNAIKNFIVQKFIAIVSAVKQKASNIVSTVREKFTAAKQAAVEKIQALLTSAREKFQAIVDAAKNKMSEIKGKILGAFDGAATWLVDKGKAIIQGLINGINSMLDPLRGVAHTIGGIIGAVIPGSPVKEGPLKVLNNGYAGKKIVQMLAGGMTSNTRTIRRAASDVARAASVTATGTAKTAVDSWSGVGRGGPGNGPEPMLVGGGGTVNNYYEITVRAVAPSSEVGRAVVKSIEDFENSGGRSKKKRKR